jgi:hypothetical protein
MSIAIEGDDLEAMERFAGDLGAEIATLPSDLVRAVDTDVRAEKDFFTENRHLYAGLADVIEVRDKLKAELARGKSETVFDLGLDDEEDGAAPAADASLDFTELKRRYQARVDELDRYPDGYFVGEGGRLLAIFVRTATSSGNVAATDRLEAAVNRFVVELDPKRYHPSIRVAYAGDVMTSRAEQQAIKDELLVITLTCIGLILISIYFFFWEVRSIFVLGAGILVALVWTFGITRIHIGYLSSATSFLSSIVAGNGINSGIILVARYLEERRRRTETAEAIALAMTTTWAATLTASLAAALSYGVLVLTDFRGFSQFGFIGGVGLILSWVSNYTVVPALLALTERFAGARSATPTQERWNYGRPFAHLAARAPGAVVAASVLLALGGTALGWRWIRGDPFEYDFRNLRNQRSRESGPGKLTYRVNEILKGRPNDGMVVLADRPEQVPLIAEAFAEILRQAEPGRPAPLGKTQSVLDLVPADQTEKLALLADIRGLMLQVLPRLAPEKRAEVEDWLPPEGLKPLTAADLPRSLQRPFTERDGRIGLVLLVTNPEGVSMWDGKVLLRFAAAVRSVTLPTGEVIRSSGQPVIFADMLEAIRSDGPWLTLASFLAVLALVVVSFRRPTLIALVIGALLIGMGFMIGLTAISGLKLNFLNFIAIPITFGIGVDYAVNMVRRYAHEGWGATRSVLLETGGAVILCSLTTIWGYLSLLYSDNQALRSFGRLAVLGEFTCLFAAVAVLPAIVELIRRRAERKLLRIRSQV